MPTIALRAVRSRRKFIRAPIVQDYLAAVLDSEVKQHFISEFDEVVANWRHKPEFKARKFVSDDQIKVNVFPAGDNAQIYKFVTGGTRPHKIAAVNAPTLAFMWNGPGSYRPKTRPGGKSGGPGTVSGGTMHYPKSVNHPGTEAREFEKVIREKNKKWFSKTMENAWRRAIRRL